MRFLDTMSLHMAISGLTGFQRTLWMASRYGKRQGLHEVKQHIKKLQHRPEGPAVCELETIDTALVWFVPALLLFTGAAQ